MKKEPGARSQGSAARATPSAHVGTPLLNKEGQAPATIPRPGKKGAPEWSDPKRPVWTKVEDLPRDLALLVETMLVEGATFEDVVEAVEDCGQERVTLHAVQNFFRGNLALQQRRIQHQKETAQALKKALGDPKSGQQEMADAILMTGLMRVNRRGSEISAKDAVFEKYERENLKLKKELASQRRQKLRLDIRIANTRLKSEQAKTELTKAKLAEMEHIVETRQGKDHLGPDVLEKIQEIYGLIGDQNTANEQA